MHNSLPLSYTKRARALQGKHIEKHLSVFLKNTRRRLSILCTTIHYPFFIYNFSFNLLLPLLLVTNDKNHLFLNC